MSSKFVELRVRGRGRRTVEANETVLASKQGEAIPETTSVGTLRAGDYVGIPYGGAWSIRATSMPTLPDRPCRGSEKRIAFPAEMTNELAFLLGAYLSEGHTTRSNWSVILTNSVEDVLIRAQEAWWTEFGLRARVTRQPSRCTGLVVSSKRLVEYLELLGCGSRASNKRVPQVIADGTRNHTLAFLQGAALDAYVTHTHAAKWAICLESEAAIRGLQDLVTRLGIVNAQIPKYNRIYDKTYYELYAAGAQGQALSRAVPFLEPDKKRRAEEYLAKTYGPGAADVIPGITGRSLFDLIPAGRGGLGGGGGRQKLAYMCDPRTRMVTRASVARAVTSGAILPDWLRLILRGEVRFAPVVAIA